MYFSPSRAYYFTRFLTIAHTANVNLPVSLGTCMLYIRISVRTSMINISQYIVVYFDPHPFSHKQKNLCDLWDVTFEGITVLTKSFHLEIYSPPNLCDLWEVTFEGITVLTKSFHLEIYSPPPPISSGLLSTEG